MANVSYDQILWLATFLLQFLLISIPHYSRRRETVRGSRFPGERFWAFFPSSACSASAFRRKSMACVYIPVQNSEEEVRVALDQLPRDASDILDILKAEQAPLDLWLIIAVRSTLYNYNAMYLDLGSPPFFILWRLILSYELVLFSVVSTQFWTFSVISVMGEVDAVLCLCLTNNYWPTRRWPNSLCVRACSFFFLRIL